MVTLAEYGYKISTCPSRRKATRKSQAVVKKRGKAYAGAVPHAIEVYIKYMGGTDRMDENINYYRIGIRGKKVVVTSIHLDGGCIMLGR